MSIQQKGSFGFDKMLAKAKVEKQRLPVKIGIEAKKWYLLGFRQDGGQTDEGKWEARKKPDKNPKKRGILVQRNTLRDSISVLKASWYGIVIGSRGVIYAAIHNFGLRGRAFGKYSFTMPKREFIGKSTGLNRKIFIMINKQFKSIFK